LEPLSIQQPPGNVRRLRDALQTLGDHAGVVIWQVVKTPDRGSLQLNAQASWLTRSAWSPPPVASSANAFLFLTQVRYNLP